jgi:hypothetical protein
MYDQSVSTPPLIAGAATVAGSVGRGGSHGDAAAAVESGARTNVDGAGGVAASPQPDAAAGAGEALRESLPVTGGIDLFGITVDPLLILSVGVMLVAVGVFFLLATRRAD